MPVTSPFDRRALQFNAKASQGQRLTCTALIGQYACPKLNATVANFLLLGKIHFDFLDVLE